MENISLRNLNEMKSDFTFFLKNERKMKDNTVSSYIHDINGFFDYCNQNEVFELEQMTEAFEGYTCFLKKIGKSASTVSRNIAAVRKFFRYLKDLNIIDKNPTKGINYEKNQASKKASLILTTDEIDRLIESTKDESIKGYRDEAILEMLYACGIKVSELINLTLSDLSLDEGYITVKGESSRYIPIYKGAVKAVNRYIAKGRKYLTCDKKNVVLFLNKEGLPLTRQGLWKILKSCGKKAQISKEITPHLIRRSMAIHLLENGADIYDVQTILGHKNINLTKNYLKNFKPSVMSSYKKAHPKA